MSFTIIVQWLRYLIRPHLISISAYEENLYTSIRPGCRHKPQRRRDSVATHIHNLISASVRQSLLPCACQNDARNCAQLIPQG